MLEKLTAFFARKTPTPEPLPEPDAQLALGTLLVRVAMADQSYLFEEIEQMDRILAEAYDLNPIEAARMRATCEKLAATIKDDAHMAQLIRDSVDYDMRKAHVAALWSVAQADGFTHQSEAEIVHAVETALGIDEVDQQAARANAGTS
ncbi:MAG: TerB family tellurite resistance protein [Pelagimonas sp.]|jgi:uncharacterized tellurite resistance protein B-like protein|nr:TerB family tellurite resistance protein [Pelagimonas sp.]